MKKHVIDMRKLAVFLLAGTLLAAGIPVYAAGQAESADAAENAAVNSPADEDEETDTEAVQEDAGQVPETETESAEESGQNSREEAETSDEDENMENGMTEEGTVSDPDKTDDGTADTDVPYSSTDSATGISIEAEAGVIPALSFFVVTPLESGEEYEMLRMLLSATQDQFQIYNLGLWDMTGQSVAPSGTVTVKIPVPSGYESDRLAVYKIGMDGSRTEQTIRLEDGAAVFETEELGLYAITQKKDEAQMQLPDRLEPTEKVDRLELNKIQLSAAAGSSGTSVKTDSENVGYEKTTAVPETGDDTNVTVWIVLAVVAAAAVVAVVIIRKRK